MRFFIILCLAVSASIGEEKAAFVERLIPWLLDESAATQGIPFADVIAATSGKKVLRVEKEDKETARILSAIGAVMDEVLVEMNAPGSVAKKQRRVNEMSSHFEDAMRAKLSARPGFSCIFTKTAAGITQRSGYPDLRLADEPSGRIFYLDPKLHALGSRKSSLRTFYFTPRRETNKVNDDAFHIIVGIEHERTGAEVKFTRWELVDVSALRVRLKAEFEASNVDMYRADAVVAGSR